MAAPTAMSESSVTEVIPTDIPLTDTPTLTLTPTLTMTPTFTSTWTPLPTLSPADANEMFVKWMSGITDCLLPCWAGVLPGTTSWNDALYKLKPVLGLENPSNHICRFGQCDVLYWTFSKNHDNRDDFEGQLFEKENTLYAVTITGKYDSAIGLDNIFKKYGQPSEIFISAHSGIAGDPPIMDFVVLYKQYKFLIDYFWYANLGKEYIKACGKPELFNLGIVAIEESQWTPVEIAENGNQRSDYDTGAMLMRLEPLSEVTNMTVEDLYNQVIISSVDFCISTPVNYWP
jgi:hypothetical protein